MTQERIATLTADEAAPADLYTWSVWYKVRPTFMPQPGLTTLGLGETHKQVNLVRASDQDLVYQYMQGEVWSHDGSQREHLAGLGVFHTSMSVGDVLVNMGTGQAFECQPFGWLEIPPA